MSTVVRVKRRLDEEPQSTLILNCKKRKTDEEAEATELSAVLKLAATIKENEDVVAQAKQLTKAQLEDNFKKPQFDSSAKLRLERLENSKINRYKIVNSFRDLEDALHIYVVESDTKSENESQAGYVYDLYYTDSHNLNLGHLEDYVSLYPYNDVLMHGSARDNGLDQSDSEASEDSNAEGNWRNDYPDESDLESITEEDMVAAMKCVDLSDLSSDEGEEELVYNVDNESAELEGTIDEADLQKYGKRYARFKAKHEKTVQTTSLDKQLYYGDIDEEEYYY